MIHQDGSIETYKLEEYNIDRLNSGKMLFRIYEQTKDEKYKMCIRDSICWRIYWRNATVGER